MQPTRDSSGIKMSAGLTSAEVEESRKKHGSNVLTPPPRVSEWVKFLALLNDPTIIILLAAAVISLAMTGVSVYVLHSEESSFIDGIGILLAVFIATSVGYLNERKSAREFELLNKAKEAIDIKVTRDGRFQTIPIEDLVVGDLVHLGMGDLIPGDGSIRTNQSLTVDGSILTGESVPVRKRVDDTTGEGEREATYSLNRVHRGTMVVDGSATYIVTEVGDQTEVGKIASKLAEASRKELEKETPLKQKLNVLAKQISIVGTVAAMLIFSVMGGKGLLKADLFTELQANGIMMGILLVVSLILGIILTLTVVRKLLHTMDMELRSITGKLLVTLPMWLGNFILLAGLWGMTVDATLSIALLNDLLLAFVVAVTIIIVTVPEGLPMMVNVSLALNMHKMAKEKVLVRKLIASETIGSATVICTDKTGTLTENRMKPMWFYIGLKSFERENIDDAVRTPEWGRIVRNIGINSEANLERKDGRIIGVGNSTECALLMLLHDHDIDYLDLRNDNPVTWKVGFNPDRKMSIVMVKEGDGYSCYQKGAPDRVLANCTHVSIDGKPVPLDDETRHQILAALEEAAGERALRVIAFSEKLSHDKNCSGGECDTCIECGERVFTALIGIADPLRAEVTDAVEVCKNAGIEVKMITGDDPRTALAIAKQCGIWDEDGISMDSSEFQEIPDEEFDAVVSKINILARAKPLDKLRFVNSLHDQGGVVGVTGDGVNDAPALVAADVGLSMGKSGSEVAKEASDIVLVDDNFQSIVTGIRWGRALYENIQRFLQFQLSVNVVALLCAFIGPLIGVPLPLTVPQLLWINIIMDTFAALALSTDPPRPGTMLRAPVPRGSHIIVPAMVVTILINSLFQGVVLLAILIMFNNGINFLGLLTDVGTEIGLEHLTVFFTIFVMFQFWHRFNCRSLRHNESPFQLLHKNRMFLIIIFAITVAQIVMVQSGGTIGEIFRTTPLGLLTWIKIMLLTASILPVAWIARKVAFLIGADRAPVVPQPEKT